MPRKSRKKVQADSPSSEPVAISEALAPVVEKYGLKPASQALQPLDPPEPELEPLPQPTDAPERNGKHAASVLAGRPNLSPPPAGFFAAGSDRQAGLRVSKSHDHRLVAIQFAEGAVPTRGEKDLLERIGQPGDGEAFTYRPERRQWERATPEGWSAGENTVDAIDVMRKLAQARNEGRGR